MALVMVFGSQNAGYRTGCCGFKSLEDVVRNLHFVRLYKEFGQQRVQCRYLDIESLESRYFPEIVSGIRRGELKIPVVTVDGKLVLDGHFTSQQLVDAVKKVIAG